MSKPIAVITGDVHFTTGTLELASESILQLLKESKKLFVPAVINGDLLDGKSIIRAECANRLLDILSDHNHKTPVFINTGNHDLFHEKSKESSLNFLAPYANIIKSPVYEDSLKSWIIPYHSDSSELQEVLSKIPKGSRLIVHQGVATAYLGHYVQDKTSLPKEAFQDFRVIASHYHRSQTIQTGVKRKGLVGWFTYIGTPYTTSFAEAEDGPKGFKVLYDDGSLEPVPLNLRKHVIIECTLDQLWDENTSKAYNPGDLLWLKVTGPYSLLQGMQKSTIAKSLGISDFKLDKIYTDAPKLEVKTEKMTGEQILDSLIASSGEDAEQQKYLKSLWREIL